MSEERNLKIALDVVTKLSNTLKQERDEARAERDEWRKKFELSVDAVEIAARLARAESERDEAREALRELWQTADAYIPQIDEEQTTKWHSAMFGNSKNG